MFLFSLFPRLLLKDSSTECLRFHWLIFKPMRINHTRSSDLELRMFKEKMFLPISGEWILPDKLTSLVRKCQTLIEAHVDVKTTDNFTLRMFCIGFTKRREKQVKRTCYAQSSQIRQIRRKMVEIMVNQASSCDLKELVAKFIPEMIGKEIEKATSSIYPLQNVFIRKVKILKAPKFDLGKLME
ncbi:hypothetical protein MKX01_025034, partial [Papaver californicum]